MDKMFFLAISNLCFQILTYYGMHDFFYVCLLLNLFIALQKVAKKINCMPAKSIALQRE